MGRSNWVNSVKLFLTNIAGQKTIPSRAAEAEGVTTIAKASTGKRPEAPSPSIEGEDIVCSARKLAAAVRRNGVSEPVGTRCSDFGNLAVVPNRFQRNQDAWLLNDEFYELRYLRNYQVSDLAKTGDADKKLILAEYGLCVKNEAALGLVADLT